MVAIAIWLASGSVCQRMGPNPMSASVLFTRP